MYYIFKILQLLLLVTFPASNANDNQFQYELDEVPCSAFDTKNITRDKYSSEYNHPVFYSNVTYEPSEYREYDYVYENDNAKISVTKHLRGCVCMNKICIRSCCDRRHAFNETTQRCSVKTTFANTWNNPIYDEANERVDNSENLYDNYKYEVVMGRPCNEMIILDENHELGVVSLKEIDNQVYLVVENQSTKFTLNHHQFCVSRFNDYYSIPVICSAESDVSTKISSAGIVITAIILLVIFGILAYHKDLRQMVNEKCIVFLIITMIIEHICLTQIEYYHVLFKDIIEYVAWNIWSKLCATCFLSEFLWFLVLIYDVWNTTRSGSEHRKFPVAKNIIIAWAIPFICVFLPFATAIDNEEIHLAVIIFDILYGITISLIIIFAILIVTLRRISRSYTVALSEGVVTYDETTVQEQKQRFSLYVKLFLLNLICFIVKILSFVTFKNQSLIVIANLVIILHGVLLLWLLIWNSKVRNVIRH